MEPTKIAARCKYCHSPQVVKNGLRKKVQDWLCTQCGHSFVNNQSWPKMRYPLDIVAQSVTNYYGGYSIREILTAIQQQTQAPTASYTIFQWVRRFTLTAMKEAAKYQPLVGSTWVALETEILINLQKFRLIDIIDSNTRFLLASKISPQADRSVIKELILSASRAANKIPEKLITGDHSYYQEGLDLAFGSGEGNFRGKPDVLIDRSFVHIPYRLSLRDRARAMSVFKRLATAELALKGWTINHNFFKPVGLPANRTPAESAGIQFPYKSWYALTEQRLPGTTDQPESTDAGNSGGKPTARKPYRKRPQPEPYSPGNHFQGTGNYLP